MSSDQPPAVYNGRYELVRLVARGGMAEVYLARDLLLDRPVALKVLFPELSVDRTFVARFRREAQAAANLSHPNIVPIYDWGESDRTYFIVMEYIDGRPLSTLLRSEGPMPPAEAAIVGAEVAAALGYAHRQGVIHRDVKPGNVLIAGDGTVKVADFGIARAKADESLTQTGAVMGTATYFSPEQAQGESVDSRSDVYSLGVVLYESVSGRPPFSGDNPLAIAYKHVREDPARLTGVVPAIPPAFEAIVFHALTKDPAQRYQTAEELRADLLRFQYGQSVQAPGLAPPFVEEPVGYVPTEVVTPAAVGAGAVGAGAVGAGAVGAGAVGAGAVGAGSGFGTVAGEGSSTAVLAPTSDRSQATVANQALLAEPAYDPRYVREAAYGPVRPAERAPRTGIWAALLVVLLIALAVVVYLVLHGSGLLHKNNLTTTTTTVPSVKVPSVTNEPFSTAQSQLQSDGFKVQANHVQSSATAGTVTAQSVTGTAPKGSTITLTVSSGPATTQVPDVHGDNAAQAGALLNQSQLKVGTTTSQASTTVPSGEVISTDPPANTPVALNSSVNLVVSSGQPQATVPPVANLPVAQAEQALGKAGLKVAPLTFQPVADPTQDQVVQSVSPPAGTSVAQGSTVTLTVGQYSSTATTLPPSTSSTLSTGTTTTTGAAGAGGGAPPSTGVPSPGGAGPVGAGAGTGTG